MKSLPEWLYDPALVEAMKTLTRAGFDAHAVGGCVRDAIVGVQCNDIDIATNARPDEVKALFSAAGFKMIPTGVEHGTWTVRKGHTMFEVTTYRRDVSTDGRRATVEFADTMEEDASRRDLTMNALYMGADGVVHDPTGTGIIDLQNGYVRFVGNAEDRCREDLLRILRMFRFYAKYGVAIDDETLRAALIFADDIVHNVSGERIWDETKKLLSVTLPREAVRKMYANGVTKVYNKIPDLDRFDRLLRSEIVANARPMWHRRYLALFGQYVPFPAAKVERRQLEILNTAVQSKDPVAVLANLYGKHVPFDRHLMLGRTDAFDSAECHRGLKAKFPVAAADLIERGAEPGPVMGATLKEMHKKWLESNLTMEKKALLDGCRQLQDC